MVPLRNSHYLLRGIGSSFFKSLYLGQLLIFLNGIWLTLLSKMYALRKSKKEKNRFYENLREWRDPLVFR